MSDEAAGGRRPGAGPAASPAAGPLASIVRGEAVRADAEERVKPDPARVADGWAYRFVIERSRVQDLVTLYEETGFEVAVDAVAPELLEDQCADCKLVMKLDYVQVYTRRKR